MKTATAKVQWYNIARSGVCMLLGEVLPRVCIARAGANESVCEDLIVCKCRVSSYFHFDHS